MNGKCYYLHNCRIIAKNKCQHGFFSKKSFISHPAIKHMICRGVIWVIQKTHKTIGHSLSYHLLRRSKYTYSSPKTLKFKSVLLFELKREVFL